MTLPASAKAMAFIVTRDRERATAFYGGVLGFRLVHEDAFAAVFDLNGTMLRVSTVENHVAQPHTVLGWEVADIAETARLRFMMGLDKTNLGFGPRPAVMPRWLGSLTLMETY